MLVFTSGIAGLESAKAAREEEVKDHISPDTAQHIVKWPRNLAYKTQQNQPNAVARRRTLTIFIVMDLSLADLPAKCRKISGLIINVF